ncbi:MAG TPA: hypothetical protein VHO23_02420 [Candidatus Paceibacterota bacterium]|nr:hypothetical protein [Candidatus Paceibacterota bacterium]
MQAIEFRVIVPDEDATPAILARTYHRSVLPVVGRKARFDNRAFPGGTAWLMVTSVTRSPPHAAVRAERIPIETFLAAGWKRVRKEPPEP